MSQPHDELLPLPFGLPPAFAEQLGYRGHQRFVGAYWEPLGDEVTVCDDRSTATGFGDHYAWSDFFRQRPVRMWLSNQTVNLGNSDEAATHWLIIDRTTNDGFITVREHARRLILQQRLTVVE